MIKECGEVTWFIHEDGTVFFYRRGEKEGLSTEQFLKWLKRKFSAQ